VYLTKAKLSALLLPLSFFAIQAQAQISGTCNNSNLNGTYPYLLSGTVKNGNSNVAYEELGKLSMDGKGGLSGSSTTSTAGVIGQTTFSGTYSVQSNCSGTGTWATNSQTTTFSFQIVNGGSLALVLVTVANTVVDGRFYRPATRNRSSVRGWDGIRDLWRPFGRQYLRWRRFNPV